MAQDRSVILDAKQINQKIQRIAHEIHEHHYNKQKLVFVAIFEQGLLLAKKLKQEIEKISDLKVEVHPIKIDKKDPLKSDPQLELDVSGIKDKTIFLVDDVLNTGRTLMHAACFLTKLNPKELRTIILVNRRHRLFPIRADFVGLTLATTMKEHISVDFAKGKEAAHLT